MNKLNGVFPLLPILSLCFIFILAHIISDMFIYALGNCLSYPQNVSSMKMNCSLHYEMNCFVHCVSTGPRKVNHILLNRFFFLNDWFAVCPIQNTDNGVGQLKRYCHGKYVMCILVAQIKSRQERIFMLKQILKINCKATTKELSIFKKFPKFQHASFNSHFLKIF